MTGLSPSPTRRQKVEQREAAILRAAQAIFIEHGYDGARMADIARRAGMAEGTIYIYFKTKIDLMKAIVANFWSDLTIGARAAGRLEGSALLALRSLAEFHMQALIEQFEVIELTQSLRIFAPGETDSRQDMRIYVAVFDDIYRRGIDRGEFCEATPVWVARDLFYGTLEYSARTMRLRGSEDTGLVIDNLVDVFEARFGVSETGQPAFEAGKYKRFAERFEAALERLESLPDTRS